jgi:hypothetical protein
MNAAFSCSLMVCRKHKPPFRVSNQYPWLRSNRGLTHDGLATFPVVPESSPGSAGTPGSTGTLRSCEDALIAAKGFVIEGELDKAGLAVNYLQERGYADPGFIQFCTAYKLCPAKPGSF